MKNPSSHSNILIVYIVTNSPGIIDGVELGRSAIAGSLTEDLTRTEVVAAVVCFHQQRFF